MSRRISSSGEWLLIAACGTLYRALLVAYPRAFREAHGRDATAVFVDACRESLARRGPTAVVGRLIRALADVPRYGLAERMAIVRGGPRDPGTGGSGLFFDIRRDVRHAARSIRRRPGLSAAVIATLALGIGATTTMFSIVDALLLNPLPYPGADRLVYLKARTIGADQTHDPTVEQLQAWAARSRSFERVEGRSWKSVILKGGERATRVRMLEVTPGYLAALGVHPIAGRLLHPDDARADAPPVVVLSDRLWKTEFGGAPVVGRSIRIDDVVYVVVGVCPEITSDIAGLRFSLYASLPSGAAARTKTATGIAWLHRGVSFDAARAELAATSKSVNGAGATIAGEVEHRRNIFWNSREFRDPQLVLTVGVLLLLAIAGVNAVSLLLSGHQARANELAVRRALGASRGRLARLLVIESLVLALVAGGAGLVLAWGFLGALRGIETGMPQLQSRIEIVGLNLRVAAFAIGIALAVGAAVAAMPALRGARSDGLVLRSTDRRTSTSGRSSRAFVAFEVAMSMVLLIGAALVGRAFLQMRLADPGFAADRVVTMRLAPPEGHYPSIERRDAFYSEVLARATGVPGVIAATLGYGAEPPSDFWMTGSLEADATRRDDVGIAASFVSPGYFGVMGIPLIAGRDLQAADIVTRAPGDETPVVVSRSLAGALWPARDPLGATFRFVDSRRTRRFRVVAVAGDTNGWGLFNLGCAECRWQLYEPLRPERQYTEVIVRVADGAPPPIAALLAAIRDIDPDVPVEDRVGTAEARLFRFISLPRFNATVFGVFAALGVALVAIGLFATVFHAVSQRLREMGIRMALGARPAQVRALVMRHGLLPVGVGVAAGGLTAAALTGTMSKFLYGVSPTDGPAFAASAAILLAISAVAVLIPAMRATRVNPVEVLRAD